MHWARNLYKFAHQPYAIWLRHGFWKVWRCCGAWLSHEAGSVVEVVRVVAGARGGIVEGDGIIESREQRKSPQTTRGPAA
jgi:hypothetical protein